jgi:L-lactate dehydrogenase complex protein LldE
MRVSLFVPCLVDQVFPEVAVATVRLLRRLGCEVDFPRGQTCCGQPVYNVGGSKEAAAAAAHWVETFDGAEAVVAPSGSCVAMVRHAYPRLLAGRPGLLARCDGLAARTFDLASFLVKVLRVEDVGAIFPARATYHPSCHGARLLGAADEPMALLRRVRGLDLVPLPRAEDCCGFGGLFSVKLGDVSAAIAEEKVGNVLATRAAVLVGTDMGCLMSVGGWMRRRALPVRVFHLAQVLASTGDAT